MAIRIAIADDHQIIIDGLQLILKDEEGIEVVGEANDGEEALKLVQQHRPDLLILDIEMPKLGGVEVAKKIREKYPEMKLLILTMYNDASFIKNMAGVGAHGFVLKNTGRDELMMAIELVMEGKTYFGQEVMETLVKSHQKPAIEPVKISRREKEVLELLAEGHTTPEIAEKLFIATHTVESHRKNLLSKCGQKTAAGLVKFAMEHKLIGG